uniref:ChrR-like cupin domain-containing protein n=1 Tax=Noccaea caerulescens TaxID=107243 RepID=A0A1J3I6J3_NOCCA
MPCFRIRAMELRNLLLPRQFALRDASNRKIHRRINNETDRSNIRFLRDFLLGEEQRVHTHRIMPGGSMKIVRETPTSAIVRFKAGSVEPAHHHRFGHDLVVLKGKKSVWNLSKKERADLVDGDYLFTPAGDVHRVKYHEDTEFFITWDGHWDIHFDEDLDTAKKAIEEESF